MSLSSHTFKICEMLNWGFNVFVADMWETQLKMFTGLQAVISGARHATKKCFWPIMIVQLCLNGLNNHARGLLLFMSGWRTVQQHLLHMHQFTENPTGGDKHTSRSEWTYFWGSRGLDYYVLLPKTLSIIFTNNAAASYLSLCIQDSSIIQGSDCLF